MATNPRDLIDCAFSDGLPRRAFHVSLVVGTILNLINQGDAIFGAGAVDWSKLTLTYVVPYLVCTYGAVSVRMRQRGPAASLEA